MKHADPVRPGHGELVIDADAPQYQAVALARQHPAPERLVGRVEVCADLPRPVGAAGLAVPHVLHVVHVAHAVLRAPVYGHGEDAGAVRVREEAFGSGE